MTRRQQGELSGCAPRTIHYHELSQSALLVTSTHSHKVAGPIRQSHTILMGCGVYWCCDSNDSEADRRLEHGKSRKYWNLKNDRFQIVLRGRFNENRWKVLSLSERKQSLVFIFSVQCSNRKRTSGLINHESFHRGLFFREIDMQGGLGGGGSTVQRMGKQLYEFTTKKTRSHPFISRLSVSFGVETCMMEVLAVLHLLFRAEQEHKEKLERYTLHLQMIKSVFSSQHLTGVCK